MNIFRTGLLLAALVALFGVAGYAMGGEGGMLIALGVAVAMNFFAYWNADSIVLRLIRERSSIRNQLAPDSCRRSTRALAIVYPRRQASVPLTAASASTYSHGMKTPSRQARVSTLMSCWANDRGLEPSSENRR